MISSKKLKLITRLSAIVLSAGFLAACPNNQNQNNNQNQIIPYAYNQNVNGCFNNVGTNILMNTQSQAGQNSLVLSLSFYTNSATNQYAAVSNYSGPVAAAGQMLVNSHLNLNYCYVPTGIYCITTVNSGNYSSGIIDRMRILAQGPSQVVMVLSPAQIASFNNRDSYAVLNQQQRLFTNVTIESVNGQACSYNFIAE